MKVRKGLKVLPFRGGEHILGPQEVLVGRLTEFEPNVFPLDRLFGCNLRAPSHLNFLARAPKRPNRDVHFLDGLGGHPIGIQKRLLELESPLSAVRLRRSAAQVHGARIELTVTFEAERRHLPVVTLRRVA